MLAILADDLTGALDSGAPYAGRGLHTEVALDMAGIDLALAQSPAVISINLGCREGTESAARDATSKACAQLPKGTQIFKKIDSRLKGHIAAELEVMSFRRALVAPAIPEFGRSVTRGNIVGFGVDAPISVVDKLGLRAVDCLVPDITTQAEMCAALDDAIKAGYDLFIGARGLSEALAHSMTGGVEPKLAAVPGGPALFVIGSRDPITLVQIEELKRRFPVDDRPAPNGQLHKCSSSDQPIVLVQAVPGDQECSAVEVSLRLAASVVPALTGAASILVLSGGATAEAVLSRMGVSRFRLLGECMPGLGLAYVDGRCIIAKSGGFGQPDTLANIAGAMINEIGR